MGAGEQLLPFYLGRIDCCSSSPQRISPYALFTRHSSHAANQWQSQKSQQNTRSLVRLVIKRAIEVSKKPWKAKKYYWILVESVIKINFWREIWQPVLNGLNFNTCFDYLETLLLRVYIGGSKLWLQRLTYQHVYHSTVFFNFLLECSCLTRLC